MPPAPPGLPSSRQEIIEGVRSSGGQLPLLAFRRTLWNGKRRTPRFTLLIPLFQLRREVPATPTLCQQSFGHLEHGVLWEWKWGLRTLRGEKRRVAFTIASCIRVENQRLLDRCFLLPFLLLSQGDGLNVVVVDHEPCRAVSVKKGKELLLGKRWHLLFLRESTNASRFS